MNTLITNHGDSEISKSLLTDVQLDVKFVTTTNQTNVQFGRDLKLIGLKQISLTMVGPSSKDLAK